MMKSMKKGKTKRIAVNPAMKKSGKPKGKRININPKSVKNAAKKVMGGY